MSTKHIVLIILDGWGMAPKNRGNAIELARKPNFDELWKKYPHTILKAHGHSVGLPDNQVGNSEAGHMNIGAGRRVPQDSLLISEAISDGRFQKNLALKTLIEHVRKNNSALHLLGIVSGADSPHSSHDHLYALVNLAYARGLRKIFLHLITDGRDAPQFSALEIIDKVLKNIYGKAVIASMMGRFFAMDRGKNWERTRKAYECLAGGHCHCFRDYRDAIADAYNQKITDEFIEPAIICNSKKQGRETRIRDNDGVIFFNLRSDRARQLTKCFVQKNFNQLSPRAFRRSRVAENLKFCALTDFGPDLDDILTAFPSKDIKATLPMLLKDKKQIYIAETEKYAHMTYFINGGYADPVNGEERVRIPSLKIRNYAEKPEMRAYEIAKKVIGLIRKNKHDFIAVNFANPDMVGHTGNLEATVRAIEHVDVCLGKIVDCALRKKNVIIITADHGNAEKMIDLKTNEVWTEHTINPVPFIFVSGQHANVKLRTGALADIAPTIYKLFGLKTPRILNRNLMERQKNKKSRKQYKRDAR
ncbi:2,3-bisphosphoglycerate-independent phosphoglycerate mutase [Candidatus Falkowbacteria bacterium]|nr:2,3-bisphosphoglycerate-independent phosphoglycerate mutase [Candidatus Falkowbacteria bacterium]